MRVLIINTSERIGGAAIAANRLMEALKNNGIKAKTVGILIPGARLAAAGCGQQRQYQRQKQRCQSFHGIYPS